MNFGEVISIAKLLCASVNQYNGLTQAELETACEALKHMPDNQNNWNQKQKEVWKMMIDYQKEQTERRMC